MAIQLNHGKYPTYYRSGASADPLLSWTKGDRPPSQSAHANSPTPAIPATAASARRSRPPPAPARDDVVDGAGVAELPLPPSDDDMEAGLVVGGGVVMDPRSVVPSVGAAPVAVVAVGAAAPPPRKQSVGRAWAQHELIRAGNVPTMLVHCSQTAEAQPGSGSCQRVAFPR